MGVACYLSFQTTGMDLQSEGCMTRCWQSRQADTPYSSGMAQQSRLEGAIALTGAAWAFRFVGAHDEHRCLANGRVSAGSGSWASHRLALTPRGSGNVSSFEYGGEGHSDLIRTSFLRIKTRAEMAKTVSPRGLSGCGRALAIGTQAAVPVPP